MPVDNEFVTALLRVIKLRGRDVIEGLFLGEFEVVKTQGGAKITSTSVGGQSFNMTLPASMTTDMLMTACDMALRQWDSLDETQRANLFSQRLIKTALVGFSS